MSEAEQATFTTEVALRYADLDTYGHVNNATYATLIEEARIDFLEAMLGADELTGSESTESADDEAGPIGVVVANLEIDFRRSIEHREPVTVGVSLADVGTSSFTLSYEVHSEEGVHATAETTMVAFDQAKRESVPIPEEWREAATEFGALDAQ